MAYLPQISTPNPQTNTSTSYDLHPTPYTPNVLFHSVWHFISDAYVLQTIFSIYFLINLCNTSTSVATISTSSNKKYDVFMLYNAIQLLSLESHVPFVVTYNPALCSFPSIIKSAFTFSLLPNDVPRLSRYHGLLLSDVLTTSAAYLSNPHYLPTHKCSLLKDHTNAELTASHAIT